MSEMFVFQLHNKKKSTNLGHTRLNHGKPVKKPLFKGNSFHSVVLTLVICIHR